MAEQLLEDVELLPATDTSSLTGQPLEEREFGRDLTSGKIQRRKREVERGFKLPEGLPEGVVDASEENVAK